MADSPATQVCGRCGATVPMLHTIAVAPGQWWCAGCALDNPWPPVIDIYDREDAEFVLHIGRSPFFMAVRR